MKLIIDIPEKVVTKIQNGEDYRYDLHTTIAQGIPYEERPQGEWIDHSEDGYVECPICNCLTNCDDNIDELHYCWNCGTKMQKGCAKLGKGGAE